MSTVQAQPRPAVPDGLATDPEARLSALAEGLRRLEARVDALEGRAVPAAAAAPSQAPAAEAVVALPETSSLLGLAGRVCLILGGATLIRALVDAGTLPRGGGVALGLAYALAWALLADRAPSGPAAAFHGLASILIAYPLLVESTTRFGILPPGTAAFLLVLVTGLHAAAAWRRDLPALLWTAVLASLGSGFIMMAAARAVIPFTAAFLALGLGALWLTYGRRWHGLRWPTALAADLAVLILTALAAWPGGPPEGYRDLPPRGAMALALALPVAYVGSFAVRMLQRRRVLNLFEGVQTALVLLVGFGGALRVALASGSGTGLLGAGVSLAGLGCYAAALPFAADQEETRANFNFFTFLALIFLLLGGPIVLPAPAFALVSAALGLAAMGFALGLRRAVLLLQCGLYLAASAVASGLAADAFRAFLDPRGPEPPAPAALATLAALGGALVLFLLRLPPAAGLARMRPALLLLGAMAAAGFGALAVLGLGAPFAREAAVLAAARTAVLSALAIALAALGRRIPALGLGWLVYPLLALATLKFLLEDLAVGRPLTLFLAFMCIGTTLILSPRLLKVNR